MTQFDYSEFEDDTIGDNLMTTLISLADQLEAAESEVERLNALLSEAKKNAKRLEEEDIPNVLEGLEGDITLSDGRVLKVGTKIRINVPDTKKPTAYKWLEDNGHGALIKREFKIDFDKDQEEWANEFEESLKNRERPLNVKRSKSVHPQTMLAFVKDQLEKGTDIPKDLFGVYRQRIAKLK